MIDKVYVTKHALTDGVRRHDVKSLWCPESSGRTYADVGKDNFHKLYLLGRDAHVTIADAEQAFEKMRASAIKAAEKKLERLRAMKFEVKE